MADTYTCAACAGTFEKGWSDEEAAAELDATFGLPQGECDLLCDDCYKAVMAPPMAAEPESGCLACAALSLVHAVQQTLLKKDALLIDFPLETIEDVLRIVKPHFDAAEMH